MRADPQHEKYATELPVTNRLRGRDGSAGGQYDKQQYLFRHALEETWRWAVG
jgi:hypothetical protein